MAEKFGANAPRIKLTVRVKPELYAKLHKRSLATMAPHNRIAEKALELFLSKPASK